ncbi:MAG: hypothetical protein KF760_11205 [Candidatus Eremiobacteraeota bacterium]|nr:hypothetical protein [Candidatus Eremiobacteraeota bacterium]MCW5870631.1 hypothetical protein [Candidatus Eremiobacteraeota bacterium]
MSANEFNQLQREYQLWSELDRDRPWEALLPLLCECGGWRGAALLDDAGQPLAQLGWPEADWKRVPISDLGWLHYCGSSGDFLYRALEWLERSWRRRERDRAWARSRADVSRLAALDRLLVVLEQLSSTLEFEEQKEIALRAVAAMYPRAQLEWIDRAEQLPDKLRPQFHYLKPLLLEDEASLRPGQRSLLAVPLEQAGGWSASLLLHSNEPGAFSRGDQDLLCLLMQQWKAICHASRVHQLWLDSQSQLVQSSKLAAVGQFAAGLAHELNTPLAAALMAVDGAIRCLPERWERARTSLEKSVKALMRSQSLVEKMLYFSRDSQSARESVDLRRCLQESLELCGVRVEVQAGPVPPVWGNPQELGQVIINLLLNARDAEPEGVEVRLYSQNKRVVLEVQDRGPGIPEENRQRVFDAFFTTKQIGSGTGLGLSVCQQIAHAHQATLEFEDAEGGGTLFRLSMQQL